MKTIVEIVWLDCESISRQVDIVRYILDNNITVYIIREFSKLWGETQCCMCG